LEANLLQNIRILESWKLLRKSKLQYFLEILGAEKSIKEHKHKGERGSFIGFS